MSKLLSYHEACHCLKALAFPLVPSYYVTQTVQLKQVKHFPVAVKIDADISHKTDVGCVIVNVSNHKELIKAYTLVLKNAHRHTTKVYGVVVQPMIKGYELIVGIKKDPTFGHVALVGTGGIHTEVFHDVALRFMPLTKHHTSTMIQELKSYSLLKGARGQKPLAIAKVSALLLKLNTLVKKFPEIVELDFNPVIVNERSATIVDVRIVVGDGV